VHGVAQHTACAQQVPEAQQVVADSQHVVPDCGQHGIALPFALVGIGQQSAIPDRSWGQRRLCTLPVAPAGLGIAATHSKAANNRSDDGTIRRRIAEIRGGGYPYLLKLTQFESPRALN
jgi:hypothetical protein